MNANRHVQGLLLLLSVSVEQFDDFLSQVKDHIQLCTQSIETVSLQLCCDWTAAFTIAAIIHKK